MFHPNFPPQEPYCDVPNQGHWPGVAELHLDVAAALNRSLDRGVDPEVLGQHFADLIKCAISGQPAAATPDSIGIYDKLLLAPSCVLAELHNSFLVDDDGHLGHVVGPA